MGDADAAFKALLLQDPEFNPNDRAYSAWLSFNLRAVDRGRRLVQKIGAYAPITRDTRVLDVGAGSGGVSIAFAEIGAQVTALEMDPRRRRWAAARFQGHDVDATLIDGSVEALPFPDSSFDVVTFVDVVEHVDDAAMAVHEIARVLAPDGIVYVSTPNKLSVISLLSDPHYHLFAVVLMPRRIARWYVEDVRRNDRGYWVTMIPSLRWLRRHFGREGVELTRIPPDGIERLSSPGTIRDRRVAYVARCFLATNATPLLSRLVVAQYPVLRMIGRKRRPATTDAAAAPARPAS